MLLGVNIDHVATLRNARGGKEPNVLQAALICEKVKCNGITIHLREDRRHIKDEDLKELKSTLNIKINLEMAATQEMQKIALEQVPHSCCIVPENRAELTTEGGLDVKGQLEKLTKFVKPLSEKGIIVSLFIDPDLAQVKAAFDIKAPFIELHTGKYANAFGTDKEEKEFARLQKAAEYAQSLGLRVNAGHGLNYANVHRMHEINNLIELNIGHSIIAKSIFTGLEEAISEMKDLIK